MARLYTGGGDRGDTSLWDGTRVPKDDSRMDLNGTLDEVQSVLGLAKNLAPDRLIPHIRKLQEDLFSLMAYIARGEKEYKVPDFKDLERWIDKLEEEWPHDNSFVLPGDSPCSASLHIARSMARRAERVSLPLYRDGSLSENDMRYINRLSDLIYSLSVACDGEQRISFITSAIVKDLKGNLTINLEVAKKLADLARDKSLETGVPMVISIFDENASLIVLERMDGALPISLDLSQKKARTALLLRMSTDKVSTLVQPGASLYGLQSDGDLCCFGGGMLLERDGHIYGAVGISGGSVEEDMSVAKFVVDGWMES